MQYHKTVDTIRRLLDDEGILYAVFEHEPVHTSEEAAAVRPNYTMAQGAKALIVRIKKAGEKEFVMVVVPGNARFDTKKVKEALGANDLRFATEEEVSEITDGVEPGGVPPLGNIFGIQTLADEKLFEEDEIIFNAGDKRVSIAIETDAYRSLVKPQAADVTE